MRWISSVVDLAAMRQVVVDMFGFGSYSDTSKTSAAPQVITGE